MNAVSNTLPLQQLNNQYGYESVRITAERSGIRNLLNCYLREVARPRGSLCEQPKGIVTQALPLGWRQQHRNCTWLLIALEHCQQQLMISVSRPTHMGNYRYSFPVLRRYKQGSNAAWHPIHVDQLAQLLVIELSKAESVPYNHEFLLQIQDSIDNTIGILNYLSYKPQLAGQSDDLYLLSEQSLAYGHAFHPTPKSRQWEGEIRESGYAPEYGCKFQLHWFRVESEFLRIETVAPLSPAQLMQDIRPDDLVSTDETALVPVHPVQAQYLLKLPVIQQAINKGQIQDLGPAGDNYSPTASVRTLYNPDSPWFLKGSLNIRITNCVRKNAIYELESALALHRRLQEIKPELALKFPGFRLLGEPGYLTLQLPDLSEEDNTTVQEGFGMVVRQNLKGILNKGEQAVLAAALFQEGGPLDSYVPISDKHRWVQCYAEALIPPILDAFFRYGFIFEPHLQNTVICLRDGYPTGVIIRDFEGVKLVDSHWPTSKLTDLSERAQQSVRYSFDQGWNRVRYCLFINNLSEAISFLADDNSALEQQLWQIVELVIQSYRQKWQAGTAADSLNKLLRGEDIPSKTNLLVRIHKRPDRAAEYVPVPSPFNQSSTQAKR